MQSREIRPEKLDILPAHAPEALRSRRDLSRLNRLLGHPKILDRVLNARWRGARPRRVLEMGASDGSFALCLVRARPLFWKSATFELLDRASVASPEVTGELTRLGIRTEWMITDALAWSRAPRPSADLIFGNLFFHHFTAEQLVEIFHAAAQRCRFFICCEPSRSRRTLVSSHLVGLIGCNSVTRYDAVVSARAGFRAGELRALWPADEGWDFHESTVGLFSHLFCAWRK